MYKGLFARKVGMTQVFNSQGDVVPVTILRAEDSQVSQIKTLATDGYNAIQVAFGKESSNKLNKPTLGHLKKINSSEFKNFGEFRVPDVQGFTLGQTIGVEGFNAGEKVRITGTSIGKGFAGNQKRHNFSRGPMTHGSKNHRLPGSIGAGSTPGRVYPGKKMAGQLGNKKVTIKNSEIFYVDPQENLLVLKGSVPGKTNALLKIQQ